MAPNSPPPTARQVEVVRGLPIVTPKDAEVLAQETAELADFSRRPPLARWWGYARKTGPGWLQSAMTLGAGTAASSLTLGALFGYKLLWVQPIAMGLGIIMLSAVAYQTLSTGERPFGAMRRHGLGVIAWAWAIASLAATVIWHFPQYALAAGMTEDMVRTATGWSPEGTAHTALMLAIGGVILLVSTGITWSYASGWRGIRLYERALKAMVWVIILSFLIVVVRAAAAGNIPWGELGRGLLPLYIPTDAQGVGAVLGAFGAAVGINMTFLFPYSLLARKWGKPHLGLARFDLLTGMLIPFGVATGLMTVAAACTIFGQVQGKVSPVDAAAMIAGAGVGQTVGHFIFGLGILGMVLSSITTHMIVAGFAACEMFGLDPKGWRYRLACLIPAVGVLGVLVWKAMEFWVAIWTSAVCGLMLPIAYIGFTIMHNKRAYLGDAMPRGGRRFLWNLGMGLAVLATLAYLVYATQGPYADGMRKFFGALVGR